MPTGKAGVLIEGWCPAPFDFDSEEEEAILEGLESSRGEPISGSDKEKAWSRVKDAVADYRGKHNSGVPPTEGELRAEAEKVQKLAAQLDESIKNLDPNSDERLKRAMQEDGGDFLSFKKGEMLSIIAGARVDNVRHPKGYRDPYLLQMVRDLCCVWQDYTGKAPYITKASIRGEAGPFLEWINLIAHRAVKGGSVPRRLAQEAITLEKSSRTQAGIF